MTTYRLLSQSLRFHWRIHLAVILGVAALAAIVARRLWSNGLRTQATVYALLTVAAVVAAGEEI